MDRVVHFEILSEDPQRAVAFYRDVFGWDIATGGGDEAYWLARTGAEGTPGIDGGIMGRHFPQAVINTVQVASLEETIARVEQAGGKKLHGPNEIPYVGLHAYCTDPDGTLFGILQPARQG